MSKHVGESQGAGAAFGGMPQPVFEDRPPSFIPSALGIAAGLVLIWVLLVV